MFDPLLDLASHKPTFPFLCSSQAKNNRPTKDEQESYKAVLRAIMEDSRVTPQEVRSMINAREK